MAKALKFYDLGSRRSFKTTHYALRSKGSRRLAVATAPSGGTSWRVLPKRR